MNHRIQVVYFDLGETLVRTPRTWLPGAKSTLSRLSQLGYLLGIASNTAGLTTRQEILALLPTDFPLSRFTPNLVLFSSEIGVAKPELAFFRRAVAQTQLDAQKSLFISEDALDVLAAQAVGMRALKIATGSRDVTQLEQILAKFDALS